MKTLLEQPIGEIELIGKNNCEKEINSNLLLIGYFGFDSKNQKFKLILFKNPKVGEIKNG